MIIRAAKAEDCETIGAFWQALVAHHHDLDSDLPQALADGAARYATRILEQLDDPYRQTLVALDDDGKLIGYVLGMVMDFMPDLFEQERVGMLADIFVLPEHRGQGVGKALVLALCDWFRARRVTSYEYYVAAKNPQAQAFWQAMGGRASMIRMKATL
jgi:GNAT superfamily N-acetyltransferase